MSTASRLLSIVEGEELLAALRREAAGAPAWVQAVGQVEQAEIKLVGQGADRRRSVAARTTLVSLAGPAGGPYGVTLVRDAHSGSEFYGGLLLSARSLGVTAWIAPAEAAPGLTLSGIAVAPEDEEHEELMPEVGDLVTHFAFGLCEVLMVNGDRLKIRDVAETARVREISIERLKVEGPSEERGKRLFTLVRKG
ncbi:MAG TPA: hypothetical protein VK524_18620 [Polyangiaceae bacterium]|nr:hypothetical protein [Polyangiaceae bacterium]